MLFFVKQFQDDLWDKIEEKFLEGSCYIGEVKNLIFYGVFVELENGIGGMIYILDLFWIKCYGYLSEFMKVGQDIDVMIFEIDKSNCKLLLGYKQLEENLWDIFEIVFL